MLHPIIVKYLSVSYCKAFDLILNRRVSSFLHFDHHITWLITICWIFFSTYCKKAFIQSFIQYFKSPYMEQPLAQCTAQAVTKHRDHCQIYLINLVFPDFNLYDFPFTQSEWLISILILYVCSDIWIFPKFPSSTDSFSTGQFLIWPSSIQSRKKPYQFQMPFPSSNGV